MRSPCRLLSNMAHLMLQFYFWTLWNGLLLGKEVTVVVKPSRSVFSLLREETQNFTCEVREEVVKAPGPFNYSWTLDSRIPLASTALYTVSGGDTRNKASSGNYMCTVTTSDGDIIGRATQQVEIHYPQKNFTREKRVLVGAHANICLSTDSVPPPYKFVWQKLGAGGGSSQETGYNSACPRLQPITQLSHGGQYEVKVYNNMTNRQGQGVVGVGVENITILILFPPDVTCEKEITIKIDQPIVIKCDVTASPSPRTIRWYRNSSSEVLSSNLETVSRSGDWNMSKSVLTFKIELAQLSDSGWYQCVATNVMGDYTGRVYNGTGQCQTRLVVTEPTPDIWTAYKFYLIGGGAAILLVSILVLICHCVCRARSEKVPMTPPSKDYLRQVDTLRARPRTIANSYTSTVRYSIDAVRCSQMDGQQQHAAGDTEFVDDSLYSWGNDFDDVNSGNTHNLNAKIREDDIYENTAC